MKQFVVIYYLLFSFFSFSQEKLKTYTWEEASKMNKDSVFSITFEKSKLETLPPQLFLYTNLLRLNLSKNKFKELPENISLLTNLEYLNIDKNDFIYFPKQILYLTKLKELIISRNDFSILPEDFSKLNQLEVLDMFNTPIETFPNSIIEITTLKKIDTRGISHGKQFQDSWSEKLPNVRFFFDAPCNCSN